MANLLMYCGITVEARKELLATFFCAKIFTTVEKTGYTNDTGTNTHHKNELELGQIQTHMTQKAMP